MSKIFNSILFLCLGLIVIEIFIVYNLNRKILLLQEDFMTFKKQKNSITENFLMDDNFKKVQGMIVDYVKKNINKIVLEKPVLGGRWIVTDIKFLTPDIIVVNYEDGHINGSIALKIESVIDSKIEISPFWSE